MLVPQFQLLFVHVPKTAGTAIEKAILTELGVSYSERKPYLLRRNDDPGRGPRRLAHLYAKEYVSLGFVTQSEFDRYFKFAVVRNPWSRLVSAYKHSYQSTRTFEDFIREVLVSGQDHREHRHLVTMEEVLCSDDGQLMVNHVLRFENLADEFYALSRSLFGKPLQLPHANVSRDRSHYRSFYNYQTKEIVGEKYSSDISRFGYIY